ncbi:PE family protein [Mycobacterium ahvazicum]|uniref:PE family protein n=1 Tax=Mycobacterium ahvazicum TaxID=1964395 RepID=A0A2K4YIF4_9MYCO|nr:PE domain-containing protein [Mycobacterium ahvazicum]SOX56533.1 PE family protein [Mycobacterium ahvazicum]
MRSMSFDPAVAVVGTQIVGSATQALANSAAAEPSVTAPAPAGAEEVSAQAAAAFGAEATHMLALLNAAHSELARTGNALVDIARIYAETDAVAARRLSQIRTDVAFRLAG